MKAGVPQGSRLSTTLFLLFINDIFQLKTHGSLSLYADDVALSYRAKQEPSIVEMMNEDLATLQEWFTSNKLSMNVKKTRFMIHHHVHRRLDNSSLLVEVAGTPVERVHSFKYLGLHIDTSLNWHTHVTEISRKISNMLGAIWRASKHLRQDTRLALYYAHVHSHLSYMAHVWGATDSTCLQVLRVLQNKAMRSIFRDDYIRGASTNELYRRHRIMTVDKLTVFSAAVATYKLKNSTTDSSIQLLTNSDVYQHATRHRSDIRPSHPRNRWGLAAITYRGALIFNNLPRDIQHQPNVRCFKKALKFHLAA